mgnify:FL=1
MLESLGLILVCQLVGEVVVRHFTAPVPGPVLGMALLFIFLALRDRYGASAWAGSYFQHVESTGKGLLAHLSLMFVPAGVGLVKNMSVLSAQGVGLFIALLVSTIATLLVSVAAFRLVARLLGEA